MKPRTFMAALTAVLLTTVLHAPAAVAANGLATARVGSGSTVGSSAIFTSASGSKTVVRVVGNFTNHTSSSVRLTTLTICVSITGGGGTIPIKPDVRVLGTVNWAPQPATRFVSVGSCTSYSVNKTYSKKGSAGELFAVYTYLGASTQLYVNGFYR